MQNKSSESRKKKAGRGGTRACAELSMRGMGKRARTTTSCSIGFGFSLGMIPKLPNVSPGLWLSTLDL